MKRYIKTSYQPVPALEGFNKRMQRSPYFDIQIAQPANGVFDRGGYIYIFKVKGGSNVYRLFADDKNMQLIFQQIAVAFYVGGVEHYDEAVDYAHTDSLPIKKWFDQVEVWAEECEETNPNFTEYEYEE